MEDGIVCPDCGSSSVDVYRRDRRIGPIRVVAVWFAECMVCGHIANSNYSINGGTKDQAVKRFLCRGEEE